MKDIVKTSVIRVKNMNRPDVSHEVEAMLGRVLGINQVVANIIKGKVKINYNLKFIDLSAIEKKLSDIGCPPSRGVLNSIKRGFIKFTEKNEIEGQRFNVSRSSAHP